MYQSNVPNNNYCHFATGIITFINPPKIPHKNVSAQVS